MENQREQLIARQDLTDEMRIQLAIDELYEFMKTLYGDGPDNLERVVLMRNNILNMMDTYIKSFNNPLILKEFYDRLQKAEEQAKNNGYTDTYEQCLNEMRVVQEFRGVEEIIIDKLAKQYFKEWEEWELNKRAG